VTTIESLLNTIQLSNNPSSTNGCVPSQSMHQPFTLQHPSPLLNAVPSGVVPSIDSVLCAANPFTGHTQSQTHVGNLHQFTQEPLTSNQIKLTKLMLDAMIRGGGDSSFTTSNTHTTSSCHNTTTSMTLS